MRELGRRLLAQEGLPRFEPVDLTLAMLMEEGKVEAAADWLWFGGTGRSAVRSAIWGRRLGAAMAPACASPADRRLGQTNNGR